jgi:PST family polysaccharide transporter
VLQSAGKQGIDLLVFLCLARWVAPEAFGLVAMVGALVVLMVALAELGLGDALVQRDSLQPEDTDSAFWLVLGLAGLLAAAASAGAPAIAHAYGRPDLVPLLLALAPLALVQALGVVPQALLQREMRFRPLALRALTGSTAGGLTGLGLAMSGGGAWSLVAQQWVAAVTGLAMLWAVGRWRPGLRPTRAAAARLLAFGRHVLGARALNVLSSKADDMVVGMVLGPAALGLYSIASRLQLALENVFSQGIDAVMLSAFSRSRIDDGSMRRLFTRATSLAATWAFGAFGLAITLAPELLAIGAGPQWLGAAPVLQWLLLAALLHALMHFNHAVFKACGQPRRSARMAAVSTGFGLAGLALAAPFGIEAVAIAYLARAALIAPWGLWLACRQLGLPLRDYLRAWRQPVLGVLMAVAAAGLLQQAWPAAAGAQAPALGRLVLLGGTGLLVYALCQWPAIGTGRRPPGARCLTRTFGT